LRGITELGGFGFWWPIKRREAGEPLAAIAKSYAVDISMISRAVDAVGWRPPTEAPP
jgi:hypothetical protein